MKKPKRALSIGPRHPLVGAYFKKLRAITGLSQRKVGAELGLGSGQFISQLEQGVSIRQVATLKELHEFYGGSPETLIALTLNCEKEAIRRVLKGEDSVRKG